MESLIDRPKIESVQDFLEYNHKFCNGRPYTALEIKLKLKHIKSDRAISKEIKSLISYKIIKRIEVRVNGVTIPFYCIRR